MPDLPDIVRSLTSEKRALLTRTLQRRGSQFNVFPLSFAQQRLWFLDRLDPATPVYNIPMAFRVRGSLRDDVLQRAIDEIVRRHETLRSTLVLIGDEPMQSVHPAGRTAIKRLSVRSADPAAAEAEAERLAAEEARTPFDLEKGPLVRVSLIEIDDENHMLLFTMHHAIADGWSMGVLIEEFTRLYGAFLGGEASPLPELPIQYPDYAAWQHAWMASPAMEEQRAYWRATLGDIPPVLGLPTDRTRPALLGSRGSSVSRILPRDLLEGLRELATREESTLFMVLLAGTQALLGRYADQEDVCVGTPIANRTRPETERLIGFFVNTLVLRTSLEGDPTFCGLIRRVREVALGAYAHQDLPFEKLVEDLHPDRDTGRTPLFQVMFALQNAPARRERGLGDLRISQIPTHSGTSTFDLSLLATELPTGLHVSGEFNTDLFDASTIDRLLLHLEVFLEHARKSPGERISRLPIMPPEEERAVRRAGAPLALSVPLHRPVHRLFEESAARAPEAIAVASGDLHLSYRELNARANRLARLLRTRGVGRETLVGLSIERSPEMLIGLLGILKAGGAYVPLDPDSPPGRVAAMAGDAGIQCMVTQEKFRARCEEFAEQVITLDGDGTDLEREEATDLDVLVFPEQPMYVIYTSGSTGEPKGVVVTHRSVVNHNAAVVRDFGLTESDRVLQFASVSFDAAVEEIFPIWLAGGRVVLRGPERAISVSDLHRLIERQGVSVLDLPTGFWHEWVRTLLAEQLSLPSSVRLVVIGGEAVLPERLADWGRLGPARPRLLNTYGPTETTVISTRQEFLDGDPGGGGWPSLTIGRPIANTSAYVVDRALALVPVGLYGELLIGGEGLATGYLGRPDLTAEQFVPDPFSSGGGKRLYRTGDRVRRRSDGTLEFAGRMDQQLKIRGFRVEPGEVEAAIAHCPGIGEVAVIPRKSAGGTPELVACCVADGSAGTAGEPEVREWLRARLPVYMLPAQIVFVDEIPKTQSGKIDRRRVGSALPVRPESASEFTPPRTPTEEILAGIWSELLGRKRIGANDDFFDLGGHSLLAIQLVSRVRISLGVEIPLRTVFEVPTMASLARAIDRSRAELQGLPSEEIPVVPHDRPLPLSFAQQRLWFLDQLEPGGAAYNVPDAVRIRGPLDEEALARSLRWVIERQEILRTAFPTIDGRPHVRIQQDPGVGIVTRDLRGLPESEREPSAMRILEEEARRPFRLSQGPLLRVTLLKLGEEDQMVLLVMHHIICDGWSTGVLVRELAECYRAFLSGRVPELPPLAVQYADYGVWQRAWVDGPRLEGQLNYWRKKLDGCPRLVSLPPDRARSALQSSRGEHFTFALPRDVVEALRSFCRSEGATLFMTMMATLQTLLYRVTGQSDVPIGTPIANRNRRELERLIGFFVNTLVIRTQLDDRMTFREAVRRVRETTLEAYAHQDVPFEKVVDAVAPDRDTSQTPLFQVMLLFQQAPEEAALLPGMTLTQVPVDTGATPFDITLVLQDLPDGMSGGIEYNADLFSRRTIERFSRLFVRLATIAMGRPDLSLGALPLLSDEDRRAVVARWTGPEAEFPRDRCLHQLVEAQAERTPDAVAVSLRGLRATYAELNSRANQVARRLQDLGIGPESVVGISIERSIEMAVGLLGIMKSGGAYLPLDPAYPRERLAFMWKDSGATLLVTMSHTASAMDLEGVPTLCLDGERAALEALSSGPLPVLTHPDNLAYVIYTSGSTGLPKGVEVSHRSVVNHATAVTRLFGLQPSDRVLQFATLNFDAALEEIFPTWLCGGTLVLRPGGSIPAPDEFLELIERERITVADLPTVFWSEWTFALSMAEKKVPPGLRLVIVGGDAAPPSRLALWRLIAPDATRWLNTYGPTEGTIIATSWEPPADQGDNVPLVPIGRPIANVSVYILDRNFHPAPPGFPGELWIGGVGVARGYRGRADLTAERFLPDPFVRVGGARMYRTGDVARFDEEGVVEFLGRTDHQVKIRGFRVELAEVESVLQQHPGVREAVVEARSSPSGERRLAAFYVPAEGPGPSPASLRAYCQVHLPEYMVPSVLVPLDDIPRTVSGKVNRELLVVPEGLQKGSTIQEQGPLLHAESVLVEVWKQVLGLSQVGLQDNFFELGGDSIMSIQVVARATRAGLRITPAMLFENPTIARLASVAESSAAVFEDGGPMTGPVPLGPVQRWFFSQDIPERHHWNQALMLEVHQALDRAAMARALGEVLQHHDALRMCFEHVGGEWRQRCAEAEGDVPFQTVDLSAVPPERLREAIEGSASDVQQSLDLHRGPLIRVVYYDCGRERPGRLLVIVHHLVIDGVSWRILLEDLQAVYQQLTLGEQVWFPMKTTSYSRWVRGVMAYANSAAAGDEVKYWTGISSPPPLPRDLPGEENTEESARSVNVSLGADETTLLLQEVPRAYGTEINDALLAALAEAFVRWTGSLHLFVQMEGHGREDLVPEANLSRTIGWFTSVFPVLLDLRSATGPGSVLKSVKEQLRAIPRKGAGFLPLLTLSEDMAVRERLSKLAVPEVSFNYLGQLDAVIAEATTFRPARESTGKDRSGRAKRTHLIDVTGAVAGGMLRVEWTFSIYFHRPDTIETLAQDFLAALRRLIQHCVSAEAGGYTPSDFGLARLDQRKLDRVLKTIGSSSSRTDS